MIITDVADLRDCSLFFLPVNPDCITTTTTTTVAVTTTSTTSTTSSTTTSTTSTTTTAVPTTTTTSSTTTTTTTIPPSTTTTTTAAPIITCLEGLIIETLYIHSVNDLALLPVGYTYPCNSNEIGAHQCNRAFFEVYGNGEYMADSLLNNARGTGGAVTHSGKETCTDYYNTPAALTGGTWTGNQFSRYSKTILTEQQAIDIAAAGGGGTTINLAFLAAMTTYSSQCNNTSNPHDSVNWLRISTPAGIVLWNSCVTGNNLYVIDVCTST